LPRRAIGNRLQDLSDGQGYFDDIAVRALF
jgi:hypothetical protein